jgi:hypothetical protein
MLTVTQKTARRIMLIGLLAAALCGAGCARPSKTVEQAAATTPPPPVGLGLGKTPAGGPSESPTGAGAGGSGAGGYEAGRVAGPIPVPTTPAYSYSITVSRMSPIASDGSAGADRGHPLDPNQPLVSSNAIGVTQPLSLSPGQMPVNVRNSRLR